MAVTYQDYYAILGVPRTATPEEIEEIQKAHRRLARKYHPHLNPVGSRPGRPGDGGGAGRAGGIDHPPRQPERAAVAAARAGATAARRRPGRPVRPAQGRCPDAAVARGARAVPATGGRVVIPAAAGRPRRTSHARTR